MSATPLYDRVMSERRPWTNEEVQAIRAEATAAIANGAEACYCCPYAAQAYIGGHWFCTPCWGRFSYENYRCVECGVTLMANVHGGCYANR